MAAEMRFELVSVAPAEATYTVDNRGRAAESLQGVGECCFIEVVRLRHVLDEVLLCNERQARLTSVDCVACVAAPFYPVDFQLVSEPCVSRVE